MTHKKSLYFKYLVILTLLISTGFVSGCSTYKENRISENFMPRYDEVVANNAPTISSGSIFKTSANTGLFTTDQRARSIGDIVTVALSETFSASKSQSTSSDKEDELSFSFPFTFGLSEITKDTEYKLETGESFSGSGSAAQSNSLRGQLSATVVRVFNNGNMEIMGQKKLALNNGNEHVRLRGIIRPEDISANNIIQSSKIVDAEITYTGAGQTHDSARMGWLTRGLRVFSPF